MPGSMPSRRVPHFALLRSVLPAWSGQALLSAVLIVALAYGLLFAMVRGSVDVPFLYGGN
jgi:hypothetical protein